MPLLKQLRTKADQVTLEADKALRINRKQGEINQFRKQIEQQIAQLGAVAYGLHSQGQGQTPALETVCQQIDGLNVLIQQAEQEIERIRRETLPGEPPAAGVHCSACNAVIPDTAAFCPNCGSARPKLASVSLCATCGNTLPVDARFCANCGQSVVLPEPQPSSSAPIDVTAPTALSFADAPSLGSDLPAASAYAASAVTEDSFHSPAPVMVCTVCLAEVSAEAAFCPLCGTPTHQE